MADKPPTARYALELEGFGLTLDGRCLLDDITWRVESGQHCAVLGPNGSGKSTLLNALLTFVPATRGRLSVLGETYGRSDWRRVRRRIGVVSAEVASRIPPRDTALEVVASGPSAMFGTWGPPDVAQVRAASELLERLHCQQLARQRFGTLSQGERQRVVIARALLAQPELLILDEPCTSLDAVARERFLSWLRQQLAAGPTVLLVTHQPEEIVPGINHVLLLGRGRVVGWGPLEQVMTSPILSSAYGTTVSLERDSDHRYRMLVQQS